MTKRKLVPPLKQVPKNTIVSGVDVGEYVAVKWIDSTNHSIGWVDGRDDPIKLCEIVSVGIMGPSDHRAFTIRQNVVCDGPEETDNDVMGCITIPIGCVTEVIVLRTKEKIFKAS